jgi:hypothetical protein
MSIEAMTLVLHHSQASGAAQMILMGIANHQGDGGAWPAVSTLAKYGKVSERRVQQIIRELEQSGELMVHTSAGGQTATGATNLYFVTLTCPADCDGSMNHRQVDQGVKSGAVRGETHFTPGVKPTSPKPSLEPSVKPYISSFDDFWSAYPRKVAKVAAIKAFQAAIKTVEPQLIVDGARNYAADPNLPFDQNFIPHPATWLNAGRWDDGPLPERTRTPEEIKARELAAAQYRREVDLEHTRKVVQESVQAAETAEAPHCEHGRIIAACMPCIRAGKI